MMETIKDMNMKVNEMALSYLPGTNQYNDKNAVYIDELNEGDEPLPEEMVLPDNRVIAPYIIADNDVLEIETNTTRRVMLGLNGPTTWIEFRYEGEECNSDNLVGVSFHTTRFDNKEYGFEYQRDDWEMLHNVYVDNFLGGLSWA